MLVNFIEWKSMLKDTSNLGRNIETQIFMIY